MLISPIDFTYSGNPSSSDRDMIRFLSGDTVQADAWLTDSEINSLIERHGTSDMNNTAAFACDVIAMRWDSSVTRGIGTLDLTRGQPSSNPFRQRAAELRQLSTTESVGPVLASDALSAEITRYGGRRPPMFWVGQHDFYPVNHDGTGLDR